MKENFQNEYLNKKFESKRDISENIQESIADYEEFGPHSYSADKGSFEFKIGETKISLEFVKPSDEELLLAEDSPFGLQGTDIETFKADPQFAPFVQMINQIRKINNLILENQDKKFSLFNEISEDVRIYFNIPEDLSTDSGVNKEHTVIGLVEDPLTPDGLATLIHEVGHYKNAKADKTSYDKRQRKIEKFNQLMDYSLKNLDDVNEEVAQAVLEEERGAWATALEDLRPFAKDLEFKPDNVKRFIHDNSLRAYCTYLKIALNK